MAQIGDPISGMFTSGTGTIGCFLRGNFFGINDCVVALTAAHVLFSHETDFSGSALSKGGAGFSETKQETSAFSKNTSAANSYLSQHQVMNNREDVCRWALTNDPFKASAKYAQENGGVVTNVEHRVLFKATMKPPHFTAPYTKRTLSESDWGLAIATTMAVCDNTPKGLPPGVQGAWPDWAAPKKGGKVFKYGQTSALTLGEISVDSDHKQFTVKGSKGKFSDEGDSGGGVFSIENGGAYKLLGIISKGGQFGTTVVRMDFIVGEIRALYGIDPTKA